MGLNKKTVLIEVGFEFERGTVAPGQVGTDEELGATGRAANNTTFIATFQEAATPSWPLGNMRLTRRNPLFLQMEELLGM